MGRRHIQDVPGDLGSLGLGPVLPDSAAPASAMQQKADIAVGNPRIATSGYKTTLCSCFNTAEGCQFGNFCHFAHGEGDMLQQKKRPYAKIPSGSSGGYFNFYSTPPGIFSSSNHKFMLSLVNSV